MMPAPRGFSSQCGEGGRPEGKAHRCRYTCKGFVKDSSFEEKLEVGKYLEESQIPLKEMEREAESNNE